MNNSRRPRSLRSLGLAVGTAALMAAGILHAPQALAAAPNSVNVPGSFNSEIGCSGDWNTTCAQGALTPRADGAWSRTITVPAGSYAYKAAINGSWNENYGARATASGADIPLTIPAGGRAVTFVYDPVTHWITDDVNFRIVTAGGSFQSELGCAADWAADCLRSWLKDIDGDGTYTFATTAIPAGSWQVKAAIGQSWNENYGQGGVPGGANIAFTVPSAGAETTFSYNSTSHLLTITGPGGGGPTVPGDNSRPGHGTNAHWLSRTHIAWDQANGNREYWLFSAPNGDVRIGPQNRGVKLTHVPGGLPAALRSAHPAQASLGALALPDTVTEADVEQMLKGDLAVAAFDGGNVSASTRLRLPGVLDDVTAGARSQRLGPVWTGQIPTVKLWAPTARSVKIKLYDTATSGSPVSTLALSAQGDGVWSVTGDAGWKGRYYLFDVEVLNDGGTFQTNTATDPYALGLSTNSTRGLLIDLNDAAWTPSGWSTLAKPALGKPEDQAIYELHIRDFSIGDTTVPAAQRGTYKAFTQAGANGMRHLRELAAAGLTSVHLLPAQDFAPLGEDKAAWRTPNCNLGSYAPDSDSQQSCVGAVKNSDAFDWGYNTQHFNAPEGSYATNPEGGTRTLEFRQMIAGINGAGLRTVLDVVYNHTPDSGSSGTNNLDKIVPGYYHRLKANGEVETSTCCPNTATEHAMMGKLTIDTVLTFARDYKVDGFRFDLMGHLPKKTLTDLRTALDNLTVANSGIDGSKVYLYGEGWNFGEVANNALFPQASQLGLAGTGIGTFNDRLRDAVKGGGASDANPLKQGFASGLFTAPNGNGVNGDTSTQRNTLLLSQDQIKIGLTGNLRDYTFTDRTGATVRGSDVTYNGAPAGYTADPQEAITYVDAHDNLTLFDGLTYKLPVSTPMTDRIRLNSLALSIPTLSQGVPFWHAGAEMLRSKSFDGNSYNSGDWFNLYDPSKTGNGFGRGLPPAEGNSGQWNYARPLLANPALKPTAANITTANDQALDFLKIRKANPLLRLGTAALVQQKVSFPFGGPNQTPGVIVMRVNDTAGPDIDPALKGLIIVFNATGAATTQTIPGLAGTAHTLDPVQAGGADPVVKTATTNTAAGSFTVPARTTAVFRAAQ